MQNEFIYLRPSSLVPCNDAVKVLHEVKAVWGQQVQIQAQSPVDYLPGQVALKNTTANVVFSWAFINFKKICIPQVSEGTLQ